MIFIYDNGIHNNVPTMMALQELFPDANIRWCTAAMIVEGCLRNLHARLLVMPGGADLYNCEKLNGAGNEEILKWIDKGGSYLGICAGAYYGCSYLDWNNGEIAGTRELALYDGTATGPVFQWLEKPDDVYNGSWKHAATIRLEHAREIDVLYDGGPVFSEPVNPSDRVIARYAGLDGKPPAIIHGQRGAGQYILSSPHIEMYAHYMAYPLHRHLNNSFDYAKKVIDGLMYQQKLQKELFKEIVEMLL